MWGCGGCFFVPSRQNLAQLNSVFRKKSTPPSPKTQKNKRRREQKTGIESAREEERANYTHKKHKQAFFNMCEREKSREQERLPPSALLLIIEKTRSSQ